MTIEEIAKGFRVDEDKLWGIVRVNEIPHKFIEGEFNLNDEDAAFALELYYQKYGEDDYSSRRTYKSGTPTPPNQAQYCQSSYSSNYNNPNNAVYWNEGSIPEKYRPISAWGYIGYKILFAIPILGFIMLCVYALSDSNINRRNYARSSFCAFLIVICIAIFIVLIE